MQVLSMVLMLTVAPLPGMGGGVVGANAPDMVAIPVGTFRPHYTNSPAPVKVEAFRLDRYPVTREAFAEFLQANPNWRRSEIKPLFANAGYLASWRGDLDFGGAAAARLPVTEVSWFAAKAFCEWRGYRLPTSEEWEYVAAASATRRDASDDPDFLQKLIELYTRGNFGRTPIGAGEPNVYGVHDLHGIVWEWVLDFNNVLVSDDSREAARGHDRQLFCAAAGIQATDPRNYAAFLRYAMRAGLEGSSSTATVGFRCAGSA